jgi:hypothetical protein
MYSFGSYTTRLVELYRWRRQIQLGLLNCMRKLLDLHQKVKKVKKDNRACRAFLFFARERKRQRATTGKSKYGYLPHAISRHSSVQVN